MRSLYSAPLKKLAEVNEKYRNYMLLMNRLSVISEAEELSVDSANKMQIPKFETNLHGDITFQDEVDGIVKFILYCNKTFINIYLQETRTLNGSFQ
jgi:hypothetical protein